MSSAVLAFDTLKYANTLKNGGCPPAQAEAQAAALAEVFEINFKELATKNDIRELALATKNDMRELETATKNGMHELETATKSGMRELEAAIRSDMRKLELATKNEFQAVKSDVLSIKKDLEHLEHRMNSRFVQLEQHMTIKLGGMLLAVLTIGVALIKYLPPAA
jgi:BMFP domain-containing protein YqiC